MIAVGDASHERLAALVAGAFGDWTTPTDPGPPLLDVAALAVPPLEAGRLVTVHRAGAAQSELRIGHIGLPRSTPDYHALLVMNMILGGQFVSRINMNLREEKGYTYGARTSFEFRKGPGPFLFQTSVQSDVTADAVKEAIKEIEAIRGERPVTARGARARPCRADPRLSAELRNRRATRPRRGPACPVRPARQLLHHLRAEGVVGRSSGRDTRGARPPRSGPAPQRDRRRSRHGRPVTRRARSRRTVRSRDRVVGSIGEAEFRRNRFAHPSVQHTIPPGSSFRCGV